MSAALISAGVALVVALVGAAAQAIAARRALKNSLALFERQRSADEQERQEQARREDAYRFADQRWTTYRTFLQVTDELSSVWPEAVEAYGTYVSFREADARWTAHHEKHPDCDRTNCHGLSDIERICQEGKTAQAKHAETSKQWQRLWSSTRETAVEIELVASPGVRQAADGFLQEANRHLHVIRILPVACSHNGGPANIATSVQNWKGLRDAREAFVEAARRELGVIGDEQQPAKRQEGIPHSPPGPRLAAGSESVTLGQ